MRVLVALLLAVAVLCSVSSAEFLTTANTLGQGKWGALGAYISDADGYQGNAGLSMISYGGYVAYGLLDNLDLYLKLGTTSAGTLPLGVSKVTGTAYGLNVKYNLIKEGIDSPVSVAIGGGYKTATSVTSITLPTPTDITTNSSTLTIAAGISKVVAPFVPYAGVAYQKLAEDGADAGTQIDLIIGSAIAWSEQGAVFAEYVSQSLTPAGGGASVSWGQMSLGVGYHL